MSRAEHAAPALLARAQGRPVLRAAPGTPAWRPRFGFFVFVFCVSSTVVWLAYEASPDVGPTGWYTSVVWTLPVLTSAVGMAGAVTAAGHVRRRRLRPPVPRAVTELLVVVVPTIGRLDTLPALTRVVGSLCDHLPPLFPRLRVDVVMEEGCAAHDQILELATGRRPVRIVTVPSRYRTPGGTRFKARANQYAHEARLRDAEAGPDVWVLHMDDDTGVGPDTAQALAEFIDTQRSAGDEALHLAQGVLSYPREFAENRLTWLADAVRPGCDLSLFAASTGRGWPRRGLHGELLLVRASVEASIGWDFGPRSIVEDAQFALHFCERYPGRSGWFPGRSYGASPATVYDFVRQRERWMWGLLELTTKSTISRRRRLLLLQGVVLWASGPLQHPALILLTGAMLGDVDTNPATALLAPLWALNLSYFAWLYWEGLKVNASSSAQPRRRWWEPVALIVLLPLFALWEVTGTVRGVGRFLRRSESRFTVIPKPA